MRLLSPGSRQSVSRPLLVRYRPGNQLSVQLQLRARLADGEGVEVSKSARIVDISEEGLQFEMVKAGVWLTFAVCLTGFAYVAATWEGPNRGLIGALFGGGLVGGFVVAMLPIE